MPFNIIEFSREGIRSKKLDEAYRMTGMGNDVARVRGLFLMYLLSEKNLSYQDLKDMILISGNGISAENSAKVLSGRCLRSIGRMTSETGQSPP